VDIHRYEKLWLAAALALIVVFIATVTYGAVGVGIEMVSASGGTIAADSLSDDDRFADPRVERIGENEYEAYVIAQQFLFRPSEIRVPANSRVTFYVTSPDVIHGFEVVGTNLNTMVIPGQVTEVTVEFDEPASYGIVCSEYCGAAHHTMYASLEVVPQSEWEGGN
jgi:cytochrome c oxidase subunit 2